MYKDRNQGGKKSHGQVDASGTVLVLPILRVEMQMLQKPLVGLVSTGFLEGLL